MFLNNFSVLFGLLLIVLFFLYTKKDWLNTLSGYIQLYFQKIDTTTGFWILTLLSVILLRNFFEIITDTPPVVFSVNFMAFFYTVFWIDLFITIWVAIRYLMKLSWSLSFKIVTISSLVILSVPFLNVLFFQIFGVPKVFLGFSFGDPLQQFLTIYGANSPVALYGVTPGMRIEILLVTFFSGLLVFLLRKSILRAILQSLLLYIIIFAFLHGQKLPHILGLSESFFYISFLIYGLIGIVFLYYSGALKELCLCDPLLSKYHWTSLMDNLRKLTTSDMRVFFKNCRPERVLHYWILFFFGAFGVPWIFFGVSPTIDFLDIIYGLVCIFFGWMVAVGMNDIYDYEIDRISNKMRPLVQDDIPKEKFIILTILSCLGFFVFSGFFGDGAFFLWTFLMVYTVIYSAPPFRLRKYILFPNLLIGSASLAVIYAGTSLSGVGFSLPISFPLGILLIFTLISTIKDLKDYSGDKQAGISTLMTLFGPLWGRRVIALNVFCSVLIMYVIIFINIISFQAFCLTATFIFFIILNFGEKVIFSFWFLFVICIWFSIYFRFVG